MRFALLSNMSLDQGYIYKLKYQRDMRESKRKQRGKHGRKILIWGLSLLQNSETTSYEDCHIPVTAS